MSATRSAFPLLVSFLLASCSLVPTTNGRPATQLISNGAFRQALSAATEGLASFKGAQSKSPGGFSGYRILSTPITLPDGSTLDSTTTLVDGKWKVVTKQSDPSGTLVEHYENLMTQPDLPQNGDLPSLISFSSTETVILSKYRRLGTYQKAIQMTVPSGEITLPASTTSITFVPQGESREIKQTIVQGYDAAQGRLSRKLTGVLADGATVDVSSWVAIALPTLNNPLPAPPKLEMGYEGAIQTASQSVTVNASMSGDASGVMGTFNLGINGLGNLAMSLTSSQAGAQPTITGTLKDQDGKEIGKLDAQHQKLVYNDGKEEALDLNPILKAMSDSMMAL